MYCLGTWYMVYGHVIWSWNMVYGVWSWYMVLEHDIWSWQTIYGLSPKEVESSNQAEETHEGEGKSLRSGLLGALWGALL